jgi:hypothetical protein
LQGRQLHLGVTEPRILDDTSFEDSEEFAYIEFNRLNRIENETFCLSLVIFSAAAKN